jgi:spermidine/putrescine transport system substrate-binding protein
MESDRTQDRQRAKDKQGELTRREALARASSAVVALSTAGSLLAGCGGSSSSSGTTPTGSSSASAGDASAVPIASGTHPITFPLSSSNRAIASGLAPENGPLIIYDWADYLSPATIKNFEKRHGVSVQLTSFQGENEAVSKVASGAVTPDLWGLGVHGRLAGLVHGQVIQPINHSYIPNLQAISPSAANPWYDQGSRYTICRNAQSYGIMWRNDLLKIDPASMSNPWGVFWQPNVTSKSILSSSNSYSVFYMAMFRRGIRSLDRVTKHEIGQALRDIKQLTSGGAKFEYATYTPLASGVGTSAFTYTGDTLLLEQNLPSGVSFTDVSYYFPPDGFGQAFVDFWMIPKTAKNPVLAHLFLNDFLTLENGVVNFRDVGYQQPLSQLTAARLKEAKAGNPRLIDMLYLTEEQLSKAIPPPILTPTQTLWVENAFAQASA